MKCEALKTFALSALLYACGSQAQTTTIKYQADSALHLGSTVDILMPSEPTANCVSFSESDAKWLDGNGADVSFDTTLATSYEQLTKSIGLDVSYSVSASGSVGIISGNGSADFSTKFQDFREDEESSLALVIRGISDHGRYGFMKATLAPEYKTLPPAEFRQKCGTHFVFAERRMSVIAVVLEVTKLSQSTKRFLEVKFSSSLGGKIGGSDFGGSVDTKMSTDFQQYVALLKRSGSVNMKIVANGVPDLASVGPALSAVTDDNLSEITKGLQSVIAKFSQNTSRPVSYLYEPLELLGGPSAHLPSDRIATIDHLQQLLLRAYSEVDRLNNEVKSLPDGSATDVRAYFESALAQRTAIIEELKNMIRNCVSADAKCDSRSDFDSIYWLADVIVEPRISAECTYYVDPKSPANAVAVSGSPLQSATIMLRGYYRGELSWLDTSRFHGFYLDGALKEQPMSRLLQGIPRFSDVIAEQGLVDRFGQATREFKYQLDYIPVISTPEQATDRGAIQSAYSDALKRIYAVELTFRGQPMRFILGYSDFSACPMNHE